MADYNFDSSFSPIDPSATREYVSSGNRGYNPTQSLFSSLYSNMIGPMAQTGAGILGSGAGFGRNVVAAAITGAVGGGSGGYGAAGGMGGGLRGNIGIAPPPAPPSGLGGGGGVMGANPSFGGGVSGFGPDAMQGNIDAMFNNNMVFLMMQTKVQNLSQQMQSISNIFKADHDARSNAIRNFRS